MSDDLVKRLRAVDISWSQVGEDCAAAADEIEQLRQALINLSNSSGMLTSSVVKDCLTTDCATRRQIINERDRTFALMLARAEAAEGRAARLREALEEYVNTVVEMEGVTFIEQMKNVELRAVIESTLAEKEK